VIILLYMLYVLLIIDSKDSYIKIHEMILYNVIISAYEILEDAMCLDISRYYLKTYPQDNHALYVWMFRAKIYARIGMHVYMYILILMCVCDCIVCLLINLYSIIVCLYVVTLYTYYLCIYVLYVCIY
jgi:hypothetical protein